MSRNWKWIGGGAAGVAALILGLVLTGIYIAKSDWLREQVRERIVTEAEKATGGKVEISAFRFDWTTLTAEIDGFVIHGTEPATEKPLLRVARLVVGLKVISLAKRDVDIASIRVEKPEVVLLVAPDGATNVPSPKLPSKDNRSAVETILDLKIGDFALVNGAADVRAAGQPPRVTAYAASGRDLETKFTYDPAAKKYAGSLSVHPLDLSYGDYRPTQASVELALAISKDRVDFTNAKVDTASSHFQVSGAVNGFTEPVITAQYKGSVSVSEVGSILKLRSRQSGALELSGTARYKSASEYLLEGKLNAREIAFSQGGQTIRNLRAESAFRIDPKLAEFDHLRATVLGGSVAGRVALREFDRYEAKGALHGFTVGTLLAFAGESKLPYDGAIEGPFEIRGRLKDKNNRELEASAKLTVSPVGKGAPVHGLVDARYSGAKDTLALASSYVALPNTRVDVSGVLGGTLQVRAQSTNLDDLLPAAGQTALPVTLRQGSVRFDGTVAGKLESPRIDGRVAGQNFVYAGELIDSLSATVEARGDGATVRDANIVYKQQRAAFRGSAALKHWKLENSGAVAATVNLQNASVADLLALAKHREIPARGTLNATAQVSGTVGNPRATADLTIVNGSAYDEKFDRVTAKLDYADGGSQTGVVQWKAGAKQIDLSVRYQHAPNDFETGRLHFQVATNKMALEQFANAKKYLPTLSGSATLTASGDVALAKGVPKVETLNAGARATALALDTRRLGDASLTARTQGQTLTAHAESNIANAEIKADGSWRLTGDYPGSAQITFAKVDLAVARRMFSPPKNGQSLQFSGTTAGKATVTGPLMKPDELTAALEIPQIEVKPESNPGLGKELSDLTIRNTQPVRISLSKSVVRVESARFNAVNTDVSLVGTVALKQTNGLNLNLNGNVDLKLARTFSSDVDSSGNLLVRVSLRGSFDHPQLGGTADLRNGNLAMTGVPNGLSNASGRIVFDDNRATIESLSAQTGGGSIKLSGFAAFGGPFLSFRVGAIATGVRVRYPEGVSSVSDANLAWTGTTERSVLSGDVTVHKVSYSPQSDLSSVLTLAGSPAPTPSSPSGVLGGTQFDVRVQTATDVSFQTGLLAGLQTEANLRLRGTAANPALLGRIVIYSGTLTFFGNKYVINEGTISFFNPVKIEPVLNVDLETQARGVDVTLTVSGPISKLNVTYRSDPPLQFSDIVGLLVTGKTPSDPTIAARQTDTQQSWQELGASALVGQAIANPVSGRLQRFFGVSKLKIDPLLPGLGGAGSGTGGSNPGARVSLEQQVTPNVIFDYVISTNSTSSQIVRLEWAFSKNWSAVLLREENSAFGIDFQYKKRFK